MLTSFRVKYPIEDLIVWMTERAVNDEIIEPSYQKLSVDDMTYDPHQGYLIVDGQIQSESKN